MRVWMGWQWRWTTRRSWVVSVVLGSDVYRLDNGLYVVSGYGVGVGGEAGRPGVCVVRVGMDGRVEVLGRRAVGAAGSRYVV